MGDLDAEIQNPNESEGDHDIAISFSKPVAAEVARKGGVFIPLKTTLETRAREKIGKVYVTSVPAKLASTVLNLVRKLVPDDGGIDFQHLRRFAKLKDLPPHVRELVADASASSDLFLIAGPIIAIPFTDLLHELTSILKEVYMVEVDVPLLAPTSQEQATSWTAKYWPTVYKKSNPFGPHPSIVERAEEEMRGEVEGYMELAERVAREGYEGNKGEKVGVVVVERKERKGRVVAVAGDARWDGWGKGGRGSGNVVAHAVMRAIGMVAGGLKAREEIDSGTEPKVDAIADIFKDEALLPIEKEHFDPSGNENGYLCHELEIYCTHEPCVMCSMAIVHSRFGRAVFKRRMGETGGLCADGELGHGLFWRKELNWTLLGWQWLHDVGEQEPEANSHLHA
ncbi:cytidine deaminase-like protein [Leptodontidium sp. MPI-SDFR-AT-0119]|nr:cytidine deaminase-like protein [Leptodontidium sp. MPI-SDFR-AT-0119]